MLGTSEGVIGWSKLNLCLMMRSDSKQRLASDAAE